VVTPATAPLHSNLRSTAPAAWSTALNYRFFSGLPHLLTDAVLMTKARLPAEGPPLDDTIEEVYERR